MSKSRGEQKSPKYKDERDYENEKDNHENKNYCGKKAVLSTNKSFIYKDSCIYVNSSESGERAVVSLEEKCHEYAFHGDDGRSLERGNLHNYTLYIQ